VESQNSGYYEYPDPPTFTKTIEPASAPAPVPNVETKAAKEKEEAAAAAASGGGGILGWLWGGGKKTTPAEEAAKEAAKAKADAEAAKEAAEAAAVKAKELEQKEREEKEQAVYEAERRLRELEEQERQEKEEALYKAERRLRELSRSSVPPTRSRSLARQKSYGEIAKVSSSKDLVLSPSDLAPTRPPPVSAPASSSKILSLVSKLPSLTSKRVEEPPLQLSQEALDTMVSYLYTYMTHLRDLHCPAKSKKHQKSAYELMEKMSLEATHSLFEYLVALKRTPEMRIRFEVGLLEKYSKGDPETESLIVEGLAKVLTGMAGTLGGSVVVPGGWVGDEDE
jgi:flagellar motility protein MotE (MotC chaperone)